MCPEFLDLLKIYCNLCLRSLPMKITWRSVNSQGYSEALRTLVMNCTKWYRRQGWLYVCVCIHRNIPSTVNLLQKILGKSWSFTLHSKRKQLPWWHLFIFCSKSFGEVCGEIRHACSLKDHVAYIKRLKFKIICVIVGGIFLKYLSVKIFGQLAFLPENIQFLSDLWHWLEILGRDEENDMLQLGANPWVFGFFSVQCYSNLWHSIDFVGDKESVAFVSSALSPDSWSYK